MKIPGILIAMLVVAMASVPGAAADSPESFNAAGALYSNSVDLANAGKYQEALDAADKALAMNVTSLGGAIQSNRAGILVMLHRYDEAIAAADAALAFGGNLTSVHSIAWYNKGNALRALGRIPEAQVAYDHAYALDNTLVPPDMGSDITLSTTMPAGTTSFPAIRQPQTTTPVPAGTPALPATTRQSPLPAVAGIAAVLIAIFLGACVRKSSL
jgi:tetratricopeptide (TPR) repeat protein